MPQVKGNATVNYVSERGSAGGHKFRQVMAAHGSPLKRQKAVHYTAGQRKCLASEQTIML